MTNTDWEKVMKSIKEHDTQSDAHEHAMLARKYNPEARAWDKMIDELLEQEEE